MFLLKFSSMGLAPAARTEGFEVAKIVKQTLFSVLQNPFVFGGSKPPPYGFVRQNDTFTANPHAVSGTSIIESIGAF